VEAARFADLAVAGINRTSLGLQSLDDNALKFLGRLHDAKEGIAALRLFLNRQNSFLRPSTFNILYSTFSFLLK
jgi:oxygen-independent coproporphyrinogen-3 oxidase